MGPDVAREQAREIEDEAALYALRHPDDGDDDYRRESDSGVRGVLARVRHLFKGRS